MGVHLVATGGTIAAGQRDAEYLATGMDVIASDFCRIPSSLMTPARMLALAQYVDALPGPVIVTHGTDAMEETAFFLDMVRTGAHPLVLTGAMQPGDGDGAQNLRDALQVATAPPAPGVLVVMGGMVHSARDVQKVHTRALDAFCSPGAHPVGTRRTAPLPDRIAISPDRISGTVDLVRLFAGDTGRLIRQSRADGLIVEALGAGNIPPDAAAAIAAHSGVVVACSRVGRGPVKPSADVIHTALDGLKARLALLAALSAGQTRAQIRASLQPNPNPNPSPNPNVA